MKAYLFPGQGSQRVGMGEALFAQFPDLVAEADAILGYSITDLCLSDPQRQLTQTDFTQPALFVVNALTALQHRAQDGADPDFVAGHSIGEYNALHFAGAMSFGDGLRLVQKRGALMATAPKGTMAAVIGPNPDAVRRILTEGGLEAVDIANLNSDKQTIISGLVEDIDRAQDVFAEAEGMFIPLNVGGAFHSRYMQPVADTFASFLQGFRFAAPRLPVVANVDARPHAAGGIAASLAQQLTAPVRWRDSMGFMLDAGVESFTETGPGDVLTKLAAGIKTAHAKAGQRQTRPAKPAPSPTPVAPRPPDASSAVADWNARHPVGTRVRAAGHDAPLTTRTEALVLFGHRAAIYMQGFEGYFALSDLSTLET